METKRNKYKLQFAKGKFMEHLAKIRQGINVVKTNNRHFIDKNSYDISECESNLHSANSWSHTYLELLANGQAYDKELIEELSWVCCLARKCLRYAIALDERKRLNLELDIAEDSLEKTKEEIDDLATHF